MDIAPATEAWLTIHPQRLLFHAPPVIDASRPLQDVRLRHSGVVLTAGSLVNPVVLLSNYLFCAVEQDAFAVDSAGNLLYRDA